MTDLKAEMIVYLIQIVVLIVFAFVLKDILAALIVSFLSRPLAKIAINFLKGNVDKNRQS